LGKTFFIDMCTFYILQSSSLGVFYTGHTCDTMEVRLRKHNSNHKGFTGKANDWRVVYTEKFTDKSTAYSREREVKSWKSKVKILELVQSV